MRPSASASRGSGNGYRVLKKGAGMPVILAQKKKLRGYFSARIPPYRRRPGDGDGYPTLPYPRAPCRLPAISRLNLPPVDHRRGLGLYFLPMYSPPSSMRRLLPTLMVLVLLLLTTNAYACLVPLYGWGSGAMQACGTPQPPVRDFCEPFRSLGFHAAPPKLPPLVLQYQPVVVFDLIAWNSGPASLVALAIPPVEHAPPDLLTLISVLRI